MKKNCFFLIFLMFFEKKTYNFHKTKCKFDAKFASNLHLCSVSLVQTYIKLTLMECKFDANLHQTYTCEV